MNRVMLTIGSINIYWYSALILLAFLIGSWIAIAYAKKGSIGQTFITDLIFGLIPVSIIGARIYYVIFNFSSYQNDLLSILKIWEGGLAIYGGIILSIIYIFMTCRKKEKNFIETLDILSASLILGQSIGRWGNFFNQEAYGPITTLSFLHNLHLPQFIIDGMNINGIYHQPMFLYESLWCLIGFIIILRIRKKNSIVGTQTSFYFIWYGIGRLVIEYFRTDSLYLYNFKISQITSIVLIVIGLIGIIKNKMIKNKEETRKVTDNNDRI